MVMLSSAAGGFCGIGSESKNLRIDRGLKATIDRKIGAIDPPRAVGAKKHDGRCDVGRCSGAANTRDIAVDPFVAQHGPKLEQDRGFDRSGAHGIDANAAALEYWLMRGAERPQQQRFLRNRIALAVHDAELRHQRADVRKACLLYTSPSPLQILAPAEACDRSDIDHTTAVPNAWRDGFRQRPQAVEINRKRLGGAQRPRDAGDVAK